MAVVFEVVHQLCLLFLQVGRQFVIDIVKHRRNCRVVVLVTFLEGFSDLLSYL